VCDACSRMSRANQLLPFFDHDKTSSGFDLYKGSGNTESLSRLVTRGESMPYVKREIRNRLDVTIETLAKEIRGLPPDETAGALNYAITRLFVQQYPTRYFQFNRLLGVLEAVKQEFYRRLVAPYEDEKKQENGDVFT
jgi:hypothetical protein